MENQLQVLISYCYEEVHQDSKRLQYFVKELRKHLGDKDIIINVDYEMLTAGSNIKNYMTKYAQESEIIIILLSPEYQKRVYERKKGVNIEFDIIYKRYLKHLENKTYETDFKIIPITFIGKFEDVKIQEIEDLLAEDFRKLSVSIEKNKLTIPKYLSSEFNKKFTDISDSIKYIKTIKSREFKINSKKLFRFLFKDAKSAWDKSENYKYIDDLFVKTSVYINVRDENVKFIIGRKGSGKTTITQILPRLESNFLEFSIPVIFNDISLETNYNIFNTNSSFKSDLEKVFGYIDGLKFVWDVFLHLCYGYSFILNKFNYWKDPGIIDLKNYIFDLLLWNPEKWDKKSIPNTKDYKAIFSHVYSKLPDFIEDSIKKAREDKIGADLATLFHIDRFREYVIGKKVLHGIWKSLTLFDKKILLSFDGFDTAIGLFRRSSIRNKYNDINERIEFEQNILLSFILLIHDKGFIETVKNDIYKRFHYCITVPFDSFMELRTIDRDSYRNRNDFIPLRWSGIELSALIRKRLIEYLKVNRKSEVIIENKDIPLEIRLNEVFEKYFPEIPTEINISNNGKNEEISLFSYLLRFSFWRPRDILYYYGDIIAASMSKPFKRSKTKMNDIFIKKIVKKTARSVIEDEFFGEFSSMFINIKEVIEKFYNLTQTLSWENIADVCSNINFQVAAGNKDPLNTSEKIEFLYSIGFLGIIVPDDILDRNGYYKYSFIFNEGPFLTEIIGEKRYKEIKYLIHPIFYDYLNIDTSKIEEFVLKFDWKYLYENELYRDQKPTLR